MVQNAYIKKNLPYEFFLGAVTVPIESSTDWKPACVWGGGRRARLLFNLVAFDLDIFFWCIPKQKSQPGKW